MTEDQERGGARSEEGLPACRAAGGGLSSSVKTSEGRSTTAVAKATSVIAGNGIDGASLSSAIADTEVSNMQHGEPPDGSGAGASSATG